MYLRVHERILDMKEGTTNSYANLPSFRTPAYLYVDPLTSMVSNRVGWLVCETMRGGVITSLATGTLSRPVSSLDTVIYLVSCTGAISLTAVTGLDATATATGAAAVVVLVVVASYGISLTGSRSTVRVTVPLTGPGRLSAPAVITVLSVARLLSITGAMPRCTKVGPSTYVSASGAGS
mmetsp:Transcript_30549/g.51428  ORF Transcript_30549/g.51428 Transcript_30549/m.51428 type:complete len:179 (+) Transcript_30549:1486-2022(+)